MGKTTEEKSRGKTSTKRSATSKRGFVVKIPKRESILYARVGNDVKKWVETRASENGVSVSRYVDALMKQVILKEGIDIDSGRI